MIVIRHEVNVHAPAGRCFDLARSVDLHVDSSTEIGALAVGGRQRGLSEDSDTTTWSARFFGMRFRMTTRIEKFSPPAGFRDVLVHGLLRQFAHVYRFVPTPDGGCTVSDELTVAAPLGPLGWLVERLYLTRRMGHLVSRRLAHIKRVAENGDWRNYLDQGEGEPSGTSADKASSSKA